MNDHDGGDTHFHADMLTLCLENLVSAGMGAGEVLGVERSFSVAYLSDLNLSLRDAMPRAPIATLMVESEVSDEAFHVKIPETRVTSRCERGGCRRTSVHFLIFSGSCSSPFSQSNFTSTSTSDQSRAARLSRSSLDGLCDVLRVPEVVGGTVCPSNPVLDSVCEKARYFITP